MKKRHLLLLLFTLQYSLLTNAQEYPRPPINLQQYIQEIVGNPGDNANVEDLYESLLQRYQSPLELNHATREELSSLYILSEKQLNAFFEYRKTVGNLNSIYELQAIPEWDLPIIYRVIPFVFVRNKDNFNWDRANSIYVLRYSQFLEEQKGFTAPDSRSKTRYLGSVGHWYSRYNYTSPKDFRIGFSLDKDAGETFGWLPATQQYGMDFTSFHLQIQNKGHLKNLVLGDYQLQMGQGLVLSAGFYIGKGAETVLTTRRSHLGIRPFTSSLENGFFRGIAATFQFGKIEFTSFYSGLKRDANILADGTASSLQTSGLHRTQSEIDDKASMAESDLGFDLSYRAKNQKLLIGITSLRTQFGTKLQKSDKPYNLYEFAGDNNFLGSLHYQFLWRNMSFYGETARSQSGGWGIINGVLVSLGKQSDLSILYRRYDRDFHSFYANSFAESSRNINEEGVYLGGKYAFNRKLLLSAYLDFFKFAYLKYQVDAPSDGFGFLVQSTYQPDKKTRFLIQIKQENKGENFPKSTSVITTTKRNFLIQFDKTLSKTWSVQSRIQGSTYNYAGYAATKGFAIMQDATADFGNLSLTARLAIFNTDDYDNRQYAYENDVLYAFSFPAYYQHGIRHYLMANYKINQHFTATVRWSRTDLFGETTYGSGLDEIAVPHRSEGRVQVAWRF